MRHRAARRLLPQLLDGTLAPGREAAVRAHAARCARCGRSLAEFELCDELLGQLPLSVVPLIVSPSGDRRLAGLARWAFLRPAPAPAVGLDGLAVVAAAAALAGVVALVGSQRWIPPPEPAPTGFTQVAYVMPHAGQY